MSKTFLFYQNIPAQLAGAVEYTDYFSSPPTTNVQDMTLNHLMVRL